MLEQLTQLIIHTISTTGYAGVFVLMFLGSALIPIPSEVVLPFTGFLTSKGVFIYPLIVIVAAIADLTGSLIMYWIGYVLEERVLLSIIKKHGKIVLLSEHDYKKASDWFKKYGTRTVLVAKLIPGLRYIISLPAGVLKMNLLKFITYSFVGSILWCSGMIYVGLFLGNRWSTLGPYFTKFRDVVIIVLLLLIAFYINHKLQLVQFKSKKIKGRIN